MCREDLFDNRSPAALPSLSRHGEPPETRTLLVPSDSQLLGVGSGCRSTGGFLSHHCVPRTVCCCSNRDIVLKCSTTANLAQVIVNPAMAAALPLVEWFGVRARVACPLCGAIRDLAAKDIKRRIARGRFTGRCLKCHVVGTFRGGLPFPAEAAVDWLSATPRPDPWEPNRRRLMVPISCPGCSNERWLPTSYVATRIRAGLFDPRCRRHRVTNQQRMLTER